MVVYALVEDSFFILTNVTNFWGKNDMLTLRKKCATFFFFFLRGCEGNQESVESPFKILLFVEEFCWFFLILLVGNKGIPKDMNFLYFFPFLFFPTNLDSSEGEVQ